MKRQLACWVLAYWLSGCGLLAGEVATAVIQSGRVISQSGVIDAKAPEEPVIAERIPPNLLDTPAPEPKGATIRQVLENRADGTPGEEVLDNPGFFDALKSIVGDAPLPNAMEFAEKEHGTLGWFVQDYAGERVLWAYGPSVLVVRVPAKKLTLVASGDFAAARLQDGNVARSEVALSFFKDAGIPVSESDRLVDRALVQLYRGNRTGAAASLHEALDEFPQIESAPDVSLLYIFGQLGLPETEDSATAVIKAHRSLPTAWFYYAQYVESRRRFREAAACYEQITMHEPPWHNWTVRASREELTHLKTQ